MIALHHRVDASAGADFVQLKTRPYLIRQPQQPRHEACRPAGFISLRWPVEPWQKPVVMIGRDRCDYAVDDILIDNRAAIYRQKTFIIAGQQQMVKPARQPKRHRILKRQSRPIGDTPPALGAALHQGKLSFNDAGSDRRVIPAAMFRLKSDTRDDVFVIHYAVTEYFCHIALSHCGP